MAREIIDAIRQAELEGARKTASAENEAEAILQKAHEEAEAIKKEMTEKAVSQAQKE